MREEGFRTERYYQPKQPNNTNFQHITKREYFAGIAMRGIMEGGHNVFSVEGHLSSSPEDIAFNAVHYADALIAELSKEGGE